MKTERDPRKQFSKRLARYGSVVWGVFLLLIIGVIIYRPETATPCIYLVLIVTANKIVDTLAYTDNSITEKILLTALDKTRIQIGLKGSIKDLGSGGSDDETEGGGNG